MAASSAAGKLVVVVAPAAAQRDLVNVGACHCTSMQESAAAGTCSGSQPHSMDLGELYTNRLTRWAQTHVKTTAACPRMTAGWRTGLLGLNHAVGTAVDGGVPVPEDQIWCSGRQCAEISPGCKSAQVSRAQHPLHERAITGSTQPIQMCTSRHRAVGPLSSVREL
jgi:hypothetical protein